MGRTKDLTGKKFGRWTVISYAGLFHEGKPTHGTSWKCICDCGAIREKVRSFYLIHGKSRSCGCLHKEELGKRATKHGLHGDHRSLYSIWQTIKTRCYNSRHHSFERYGAAGVELYEPWQDSFEEFLKGVGPRPSKLYSLDRYPDPWGNYEPGNVRWATDSQQACNTRRTRHFQWKGKPLTLTEIARLEDVRYTSLYQRVIGKGDTPAEAVEYCRTRGLPFFERSALFGGSPDARITEQRRVRSK